MNFIEKWFCDRKPSGGLLLLIDPDRGAPERLADMAEKGVSAGASAVLVGSSILLGDGFERCVREVRGKIDAPVFLFPGNGHQITLEADGILFLTLISGRNPRWLIEEQVESAPKIKAVGLPSMATGYILIESGKVTAVQFMSATVPIPRNKPDIASAHAMAGELLGLKAIFLEAGSGAENPVPEAIVSAVRDATDLPLIVGGGIRTVESAQRLVSAGADFIVVGTHFEQTGDTSLIEGISRVIRDK